MFLVDPLHNRLLQVSVFASIVYYLTASPLIFDKARKMFPIKFKKVHHQLLFHTFVFGVLMYLLTYFVFDPALKVFEGNNKGNHATDFDQSLQHAQDEYDRQDVVFDADSDWAHNTLASDDSVFVNCYTEDENRDPSCNFTPPNKPETAPIGIRLSHTLADSDKGPRKRWIKPNQVTKVSANQKIDPEEIQENPFYEGYVCDFRDNITGWNNYNSNTYSYTVSYDVLMCNKPGDLNGAKFYQCESPENDGSSEFVPLSDGSYLCKPKCGEGGWSRSADWADDC